MVSSNTSSRKALKSPTRSITGATVTALSSQASHSARLLDHFQ